ncbi:hypothetical protein PMI27_001730 [Pseudomonas sp. GM41(2012)]|nr:hypothetical protein PMI27_001730 [Pseudomonas sp. GM41(2012)]
MQAGFDVTTECCVALRDFAAPFAIKLKASWGLPQALRELIGAIYALPPMQVRGEQVVKRTSKDFNDWRAWPECIRERRLGTPPQKSWSRIACY